MKYIERRCFLSEILGEDKDIIRAEKIFLNETEYLIKEKINSQTIIYKNHLGQYYIEENTYYNSFHVHSSIWDKIVNVGFSSEESRQILKHCIKKFINNKVTTVFTTVAFELNNIDNWKH